MIEQFTPAHSLWSAYIAHLNRVKMALWVVDENEHPKPGIYFLGVITGSQIIGHISLQLQAIIIPRTEWGGGGPSSLVDAIGVPLRETFVQTFAVDEEHRRKGYGRELQIAALTMTKELGAYQMRSWSSSDKPANYALKISLGFSAHPTIYTTDSGLEVSGVYFIKTLQGQ
jgi:GNAT superfamily N-acetyltransferase